MADEIIKSDQEKELDKLKSADPNLKVIANNGSIVKLERRSYDDVKKEVSISEEVYVFHPIKREYYKVI